MNPETNGEKVDVAQELQRLTAGTGSVGGTAIEGYGASASARDTRPVKPKTGPRPIRVCLDRLGENPSMNSTVSASEFMKLDEDARLLVGIGMAGSSEYEGVFETKKAEDEFLLKIANKRNVKEKSGKDPMDEDTMKERVRGFIEQGKVRRGKGQRPRLTEEGMAEVHGSIKKCRGSRSIK